jgi:tripartite-type tricarboxylate transporter receptor subunit TctC
MSRLARCVAILTLAFGATATAQTYPTKPVTIVVPFPPGGSSDTIMRLIAKRAQEALAQPMVIDNRAGAGGVVGAVSVKNAAPDGYTLYMGHTGTHVVNVSLYPKLEYDPQRDFKPITTLFSFPSLLVIPAGSTAKSVPELVALARTRPGGLNFTSQGIGTTGHLIGELFRKEANAPMVHIPMKGAAAAVAEVVATRADLLFSSYITAGPFIRDGRLRILGIAAAQRTKALPDVPTLAELGVKGVDIDQWFGLFAPAGTPDAIVRRLSEEFSRAARAPEVVKTLTDQAADGMGSTPEAFAQMMAAEIPRIARVVTESGAKPD